MFCIVLNSDQHHDPDNEKFYTRHVFIITLYTQIPFILVLYIDLRIIPHTLPALIFMLTTAWFDLRNEDTTQ